MRMREKNTHTPKHLVRRMENVKKTCHQLINKLRNIGFDNHEFKCGTGAAVDSWFWPVKCVYVNWKLIIQTVAHFYLCSTFSYQWNQQSWLDNEKQSKYNFWRFFSNKWWDIQDFSCIKKQSSNFHIAFVNQVLMWMCAYVSIRCEYFFSQLTGKPSNNYSW